MTRSFSGLVSCRITQSHFHESNNIQQYPTITFHVQGTCCVLVEKHLLARQACVLGGPLQTPNPKLGAVLTELVVVAPSLFSILFVEDIGFLHAFTGTRNVWINEDTCIVEWHLNENGMIGTKAF